MEDDAVGARRRLGELPDPPVCVGHAVADERPGRVVELDAHAGGRAAALGVEHMGREAHCLPQPSRLFAVLAGDLLLVCAHERAAADDVLAVDDEPVDPVRAAEHEVRDEIVGASELEAVRAPDREVGALPRLRASRCRRGAAHRRRRAWPAEARRARSARRRRPGPRATSSAFFRSTKMSLRSFEALPSTPSPTRTWASSMARTGATPAPSRRFEVGQCATPTPASPKVATSSSERWTQCAHHTSSAIQPTRSRYSTGVQSKSSRQ